MSVRVLLVDDHAVLREGLRAVLETDAAFEVVGEAGDGDAALELARRVPADLAIVDLKMPGVPAPELVRALRGLARGPQVLVLTSQAREAEISALLEAGAGGFQFKDADRRTLLDAARKVAAGEPALHADAQRLLLQRVSRPIPVALTPREHSVALLVARGASNKVIARELDLTLGTVKGYVSQILAKLGLEDRTDLALYAVRQGWVEP